MKDAKFARVRPERDEFDRLFRTTERIIIMAQAAKNILDRTESAEFASLLEDSMKNQAFEGAVCKRQNY